MDTLSIVIKTLGNIGIDVGDNLNPDTDLREYVDTSVLLISFIVELEEALNIEFPDVMLLSDNLSSLSNFCKTIEGLVDEK